MSREIKFRAWNEKTKRFTKDSDNAYLSRKDSGIICEQYTGLKDKNGKEIYEGDIVEFSYSPYLNDMTITYREQVAFDIIEDGEGFYHFDFLAWITIDKDGEPAQSLIDIAKYSEIIGNIHENPELLGDEDA